MRVGVGGFRYDRDPPSLRYPPHLADDLPCFGRHGLNGQARLTQKRHICQAWLRFYHFQGDGAGQGLQGFDIHAVPTRVIRGAVGMARGDDLDNTHHGLLGLGMIEKSLIPDLHLPHKIARLVIAHAVPFLALIPARALLRPTPCVGFGFEQPIGHQPMTFFQASMRVFAKSPALA